MSIPFIQSRIRASVRVKEQMLNDPALMAAMAAVADAGVQTYKNGGKILFCGNGGSAADAQHLAAELSGRFYRDRDPLFSEALHVNSSYMTAVGNDYGYHLVYARAIKAFGKPGDILIGLSTSGNAENVVNAFEMAKTLGVVTVGMTGKTGGELKAIADHLIRVPSKDTPRIQEAHILLGHILCEWIENSLFPPA